MARIKVGEENTDCKRKSFKADLNKKCRKDERVVRSTQGSNKHKDPTKINLPLQVAQAKS